MKKIPAIAQATAACLALSFPTIPIESMPSNACEFSALVQERESPNDADFSERAMRPCRWLPFLKICKKRK